MPRPKSSEKTWSCRFTKELEDDIIDGADRLGVSASEWVKQACMFKLKLQWAIQADWYKLRQLDPWTLRQLCTTMSDRPFSPKPD